MRLIDSENIPALFDEKYKETKKLILKGERYLDNLAEGFTEADIAIREMPAIDAVPVVRCDSCVLEGNCFAESYFRFAGITNPFCCAGKRKEGADG